MYKCNCINNSSLKGALILNKTYFYIIDYDNKFYPYYIYESEREMFSMIELEMYRIASVSEQFFNNHFINIKQNRRDKLKELNGK